MKDDVLTVAVTKFEKTSVAAVSAACGEASQSFAVGEGLAKKLNKPSLRAVFVLSDGLKVNGSELVKGLNSALDESVVVTGGLAGDGARFERTWVSLNESVGPGAVVAIGLYGDFLRISHGSKGGWDKFGPERVVTKAEGNVLYELDGKPALSIYKEYLGEKASGLPGTGLLFPLSLRANSKDEKALVRTILAVDEAKQSMTFAGDVPVGFLAQLMKADFERLIGGAATAATTAKKLVGLEDPNTLAIAVLGERTEEEVEAVMDVLPKGTKVTGFYSYGELSPYASGRCDLHNQTMTLTTFSESATPIVRSTPKVAPVVPPVPPVSPAVRASSDSGVRRASSDSMIRSAAPAAPAGMRVETLTYDVKQAKWSAPFPALDSAKTLVLAFGDPALIEAPGPLKALKQAFPASVVAGCSGSGEIVGTTVKDDVLTVAVTKFEKTSVAAVSAA
ncbi:MAG: FIST C-terminal domain-containing protein, partial [Myxococcaceae bacterium]|nr:FIST C-terminal domain-containing protein [Myxococcaceae bacterium]